MVRDSRSADALRRAWTGLEPPPPQRELAEEDARTQAAVSWMQQAWDGLEIPAAPGAGARRRRRPRVFLLRAAAALVAAAGISWWWLARSPAPSAPVLEETAALTVALREAPPQVLANRAGRVEMRSGSVRLTLLRPDSAPSADDLPSPPEPSK